MVKRRRVSAPAPPSPILVIDDGSDDDEIDLTSDNGNGSNHGGGGWYGGSGVCWSCSMCTYENAAAVGVCEMCSAARLSPPPAGADADDDSRDAARERDTLVAVEVSE